MKQNKRNSENIEHDTTDRGNDCSYIMGKNPTKLKNGRKTRYATIL